MTTMTLKKWLINLTCFYLLFAISTASAMVITDAASCNKVANIDKPFTLELKAGDNFPEAIFNCVKGANLERASVLGEGDLKDPTLTYFNVAKKQFQNKPFSGVYEISSMTGEIVVAADILYKRINLHATLANSHYQTIGGHLTGGTVAAIASITIIPIK